MVALSSWAGWAAVPPSAGHFLADDTASYASSPTGDFVAGAVMS